MTASTLALTLLPETFAVCRLGPDASLAKWPLEGALCSLTRSKGELSVVCEESHTPDGARVEGDWRALVVAGPLAFEEVGILAELAGALAAAGVSLFAISTFDTDYLLVKHQALDRAIAALRQRGHKVEVMP